MDDVPQVVARAAAAADAAGFPRDREKGSPSCCSPGTGRVLAMLAASRAGGRIGEIGTGTGYGTSWMASAMPAGATLLTVELDAGRAEVASMLFDGLDAVHVVHGDACAVIAGGGPYDLLFADSGGYGDGSLSLAEAAGLLRIGGQLVVDDVTPLACLPADSPFRRSDPKRQALLGDDRLVSAELVLPTLTDSVLVGTRVR